MCERVWLLFFTHVHSIDLNLVGHDKFKRLDWWLIWIDWYGWGEWVIWYDMVWYDSIDGSWFVSNDELWYDGDDIVMIWWW